jgi:hypothetical protein
MPKGKIKFVKPASDNKDMYRPEHKLYKFYQLCMYKDPTSNKHNVRVLLINENQDIVKQTNKRCTTEQYDYITSHCKDHEYRVYPTYDLDLVDYPNVDDLLKMQSELLQ